MAERFSKKLMVARLTTRKQARAEAYFSATGKRVDPATGWAQCGQDPHAHRIYGEWRAFADLLEAMNEGWL